MFPVQRGRYPLLPLLEKTDGWQENIESLGHGLEQLAEKCADLSVHGEIWNSFAERAGLLQQNLNHIAGTEQTGEDYFIRWYERRERTVNLSATPVKIADELENCLYGSVESIIMTSATLTTGGDFKYVRERLGVDDSAKPFVFIRPLTIRGGLCYMYRKRVSRKPMLKNIPPCFANEFMHCCK